MYNSILVGFLAKIWNAFVSAYEYSIVKKIANLIKRTIKYLFNGSIIKDIFIKDNDLEDRFLYRIYSKTIDIINNILDGMNNFLKRLRDGSRVSISISNLFKDSLSFLQTICIFLLFFSIGILFINIVKSIEFGYSYIMAILLIVVSTIGLLIGDRLMISIKDSKIYGFVEYMFSTDEGGEQWW